MSQILAFLTGSILGAAVIVLWAMWTTRREVG